MKRGHRSRKKHRPCESGQTTSERSRTLRKCATSVRSRQGKHIVNWVSLHDKRVLRGDWFLAFVSDDTPVMRVSI